jgi:hypothetical protein
VGGAVPANFGIVFQATTSAIRLDGSNPALSEIDNFNIDCGTY